MTIYKLQIPASMSVDDVDISWRRTDKSKTVLVTVNKSDDVVVTKEAAPAPTPPPTPAPVPPAPPTPPVPPPPVPPVPPVHPDPPPVVPPVAGKPYKNPIHPTQLADPSAVLHNGKSFMVGTDSRNVWIGALQGPYQPGPIILPQGAWAPDQFISKKDGLCYTYYTIGAPPYGIRVRSSATPDGPTIRDFGIIIPNANDGHVFEDTDGELYLYSVNMSWHTTHAPPGFWIQVTKMASPAQPVGQQIPVVTPDSAEEAGVDEGPSVKRRGNIYYMTYSFGNADKVNYSTAYATSLSPMGPFLKRGTVMKSGNGIYAPGHGSIVIVDDIWWFLYYQKLGAAPGFGDRRICFDRITFDVNGVLQITPTRGVSMPGPR